jgi:hypothetical protein
MPEFSADEVRLSKVHAGQYRVEIPHPTMGFGESIVMFAYRNEAGFSGRDWYLTDAVGRTIEDMLPSLKESIVVAYETVQKGAH